LRLGPKEFAEVLGESPSIIGDDFWPVAESYKIAGGWIYAEVKERNTGTKVSNLADPGLFLSFARLGSHGEPSKGSILSWVKQYGLLRAEQGKDRRILRPAPLKLENFRAEVLCAYQLLNLYTNIRTENIGALRATIMEGARRPYSEWPNTPRTAVETDIARIMSAALEAARADCQMLRDVGFWELEGNELPPARDLFIVEAANAALRVNVKKQVRGVRLGFGEFGPADPAVPLGDNYMVPSAYDPPICCRRRICSFTCSSLTTSLCAAARTRLVACRFLSPAETSGSATTVAAPTPDTTFEADRIRA